jgi:hypothetical protein
MAATWDVLESVAVNSTNQNLQAATTDPYLLWAELNDWQRVGRISPAPNNRAGNSAAGRGRGGGNIDSYWQVVVQLASSGDTATLSRNKAAIERHLAASRGGFRIRGAYKKSHRMLLPDTYFVTGIVADRWRSDFLGRIDSECLRWEISHARTTQVEAQPNGARWPNSAGAHPSTDQRLNGNVMVVIDYGCPFAHTSFRETAGADSRVKFIWFQDIDAVDSGPIDRVKSLERNVRLFPYGGELRGSDISSVLHRHTTNGVVDEAACYEAIGYDLMREASTHGGHVMSIACGWPNPLQRAPGESWLSGLHGSGFATASESLKPAVDPAGASSIIFIELPRSAVKDSSGGAMSAHLIDALQYVLHRVTQNARVTINCSFGTQGGPHDGTSMLESAMDAFLHQHDNFSLVMPVGNAFNNACHARAQLSPKESSRSVTVKLDVPADKRTDTFIDCWYTAPQGCVCTVSVAMPGCGASPGLLIGQVATLTEPASGTGPIASIAHGNGAISQRNRVLIAIAPTTNNFATYSGEAVAPYGHWQITFAMTSGVDSVVDLWIERDDPIFDAPSDRQARFVVDPALHRDRDPDEEYVVPVVTKVATCTSYATAACVIAVAGYVRPTIRESTDTNLGSVPHLVSYSAAADDAILQAAPNPNPLASAAVDDSPVLLGRNAAGNRARAWVRRNGTSVAAPQLARHLLNCRGDLSQLLSAQENIVGLRGDGLSAVGRDLQALRNGAFALPW